MPHQQNPERRPGDAAPDRPRTPRPGTAAPEGPRLPRQRHQAPARPPANATPPAGPARGPRPAGPGGGPSDPRPTRIVPGSIAPGGPGGPGAPRTPGTPPSAPRSAGPARDTATPTTVAPASASGAAAGSGGDTTVTAKKESDLSFNKVAAGAGAAVVTAVLGSFLGAIGTILGAAAGSIITTFATTVFQRSIERTRTEVVDRTQKARERVGQRGRPGAAVWQDAAREGAPGGQETVRIDPSALPARSAPAGRRFRMGRKSILISAAGALLAFGLAMFLVTGLEFIKGSPITGGGSGTSIQNAVRGAPPAEQQDDEQSGSTSTSESATATSESETQTSEQPTGTSENETGTGSPGDSSNPLQDGLNRVLPSQSPQTGQQQSGPNGGAGGQNGTN